MTMLQSAVPLRIGAAIEEATGQVIDATPRIGWLLDLVSIFHDWWGDSGL